MPINDPTQIPKTSYTKFALETDPQLRSINSRQEYYAPNGVDQAQVSPLLPYRAHRNNPVIFYDRTVPYVGDITYFRSSPPGENLNVVDRPATEDDKRKFPNEYNAYLANRPQKPNGTPLEVIGLPPQHIKQLEAHHVFTVEQLSELSEPAEQTLLSFINTVSDYKRRAINYRNYAKFQKLADEKDQKIAELRQEIDQLKKRQKPKL